MGKAGTAVAKDSADLILVDDRFSSIVNGIEEGRIAYGNVRKLVFLLISTGAAEVVLFVISVLWGLPMPLTAIQLLWLNVTTEGIQHIALAFELGEGDELHQPPRKPQEPIFNRVMIERVVGTALVGGTLGAIIFGWSLNQGMSEFGARNLVLLFFVLFENIVIIIARSERRSAFLIKHSKNPWLLLEALGAQMMHLWAINYPPMAKLLDAQPIAFRTYFGLLGMAIIILGINEFYMFLRQRKVAST